MSAKVKYTPLAPVYKAATPVHDDEEIALEELSAAAPERAAETPACDTAKDAADAKSPLSRRIARCLCVTLLVGMCLWMITGAAMVTYIGAKAHRCMYPRHHSTRQFTWTPASLPSLELGVVTGSLNIRSCSKAKNVTLTVRTYAGTQALLNTMVLTREAVDKGERIVLLAPSFDWAHCQHATFDLVVPEGAGLDIKAQAIVGRVNVKASKSAVRNLVLTSSAAYVDLRDSHLSGALRLDSELGCVRARNVRVRGDLHAELRFGFLNFRHVSAAEAVRTTLRIGRASLTHVRAATELTHTSEIGYVNMWDSAAPSLIARVDYGALYVAVASNFAGNFVARSPYGFLSAKTAAEVASRYQVAQETLALIEGTVSAHPITSSDFASMTASHTAHRVELDAVYGRVDLFVPAPDTRGEKARGRHHHVHPHEHHKSG